MSVADRAAIKANVEALAVSMKADDATPPFAAVAALLTTALCDLNRIADELEARPGYCAPKPLSELRFG